ncbi:MAG: ABC transporter ATP-binding protein [Siculibacillus sp.]|nr:ABC transporter ATP-binding protein [Siculibacillus sp.]
MSFIDIRGLKKSFGATTVVHDFDLSVERGEFISFLGPSGCGKTTILRMIAGFESVTAGSIAIAGKEISRLPPAGRDVGMVFQAYALFPNMTVAQNIAFGLRVAKKSAAEIRTRVAEMLDLIKLPALGDRYPYQLSGGQQQRVALARAIAVKPQVLLLDEPLSALDAKIRVSLREEIRSLQKELGITTIFVTHDQEEALSMSDRIVVLADGRTEQIGSPFEVYNWPRTRFVASFVGTLNLLAAEVIDADAGTLRIDGLSVATVGPIRGRVAGDRVTVALRPEAVTLGPAGGDRADLPGTVEEVSFLGAVVRIRVRLGEQTVSIDGFNQPKVALPAKGDDAVLRFAREDLLVLEGDG